MDFKGLFYWMIFDSYFIIGLMIDIFEWHYLERLWLVLSLPIKIMDISSNFLEVEGQKR